MRFAKYETDKPPDYLVPDIETPDTDVSDCGCECANLMEQLYDAGMETECRHACKVHNHMPMYGKEKFYGQNWMKRLHLCPRCVDATPVGFRVTDGKIEAYCRKCSKLRHVGGDHLFFVDVTKFRRIIDG